MQKKYLLGVIAALLCVACIAVVVIEGCTSKTKRHSLDAYTNLIGSTLEEAETVVGTKVTFKDIEFSPELLSENGIFTGIELSAQLNDPNGKVADIIWNFAKQVDDEYNLDMTSYENVYSDKTFMELTEKEYQKNLETALKKRGAYIFEVNWDIMRLATKRTKELLAKMGQQVLKETEDRSAEFIWTADERLDITVHATIWDDHKAELTVTCKAMAELAAGLDFSLKRAERHNKFFRDSYLGLLQEENLSVVGYSFETTNGNTVQLLEEIYLQGEDYVHIIDNGISKRIYVRVDGALYKSTYRDGEYSGWEVLTEEMAHPLPWIGTDVDAVFHSGYGGQLSGMEDENAFTGAVEAFFENGKAEFWVKANSVYKAEYKHTEETLLETQTVVTESKRAFEITVISHQEAKAIIEEYKAMMP